MAQGQLSSLAGRLPLSPHTHQSSIKPTVLQTLLHSHQQRRAGSQHRDQIARHCRCQAAPAAVAPEENQTMNLGPRKRLIIMRHADSENFWRVKDHERPITEEGRKSAFKAAVSCKVAWAAHWLPSGLDSFKSLISQPVAKQLQEHGWLPSVIMCSNSLRTQQTLDSMKDAVDALCTAEAHFRGSLYTIAALDGQTRRHLQDVITDACRSLGHDCIMCLGHNKGFEEAASSFAGQPVRLGTAHAALLEGVGASWREAFAEGADWKLVGVVSP